MNSNIIAAEEEIVAECLCRPERIPEVGPLEPAAFSDPRCRRAWGAMLELFGEGKDVDPFSVAMRGPPLEVTDLSEWCARASFGANLEVLGQAVRDAHITSRVFSALGDIKISQQREDLQGAELLSTAMEILGRIVVDTPGRPMAMGALLKERVQELTEQVARRDRGEESTPAIPTGIKGLDRLLGGLKPQRITLLAGRPSQGKSAVSRQIADNATSEGYPTHYFSMEDSRAATADRSLSATSGIAADQLESLEGIGSAEMGSLWNALDRFGRRPEWLVDLRSGLDVDEIVRSVRAHRPKLKTRLVVVDYVGLMRRRSHEKQKDMLDRAMKTFLAVARSDDLSFLLLSQLNRECESRSDKRPKLSDLKDSGSLEEEAKTVLFLYRDRVYNRAADPTHMEIIVAKNANGKTGTVRAEWDGPTMTVK